MSKSMRSPPTTWKKNIWGAFSPSGRGPFSPFWVHYFSCWGLFSLCGGRLFSTYIEKFLGLFPLPKIGAHALAARVVANIALGKFERNCET